MVNGRMISPYLNLTAEDDVIGNGRIISSAPHRRRDHQQLGGPGRQFAARLRSHRRRRGGAGDETTWR